MASEVLAVGISMQPNNANTLFWLMGFCVAAEQRGQMHNHHPHGRLIQLFLCIRHCQLHSWEQDNCEQYIPIAKIVVRGGIVKFPGLQK